MARRRHSTHEDVEETRRNIVRTAQKLFMEFGFRAVSTRQIAAACGLTQPALYHHFADKQDLYVAMAQEEVARLSVALERIVQQNDDLEQRLQEVMLYLLGTMQHDLNLMFHDIRHELTPERRDILNQAFLAGVVNPIASIFEDGLRSGLLRDKAHGGVDILTSTYLFLSMVSAHLPQSGHISNGQHEHAKRITSDVEMAQKIVYVLLHGIGQETTG